MTTERQHRRIWLVAGTVALAAALLLVANWQWAAFASAVATSERRPALLADAEWRKPASARMFNARFAPGASAGDLLTWLTDERFTIDRSTDSARLSIDSFPCNERVAINWTATAGGILKTAQATVFEAGCP